MYIICIYLFSLHELMLPSFDYNMLCKFLLASEDLLNKSLMCIKETECNLVNVSLLNFFLLKASPLQAQILYKMVFNMENGEK